MRTRSSWSFGWKAAAATVAVAAAVSGCGGSGSDESADEPTSSTSSTASPTESPTGSPTESPTASSSETAESSDDASGSEAQLEAYAAAAEDGMNKVVGDAIKDLYSSMTVKAVPPSGIEYVYVFKKPIDVDNGGKYLQSQAKVLKATFTSQIAPEMEGLGFANPSATWTYLNPDGTEIWSKTVS